LYTYFQYVDGDLTNDTKTVRIVSNLDEPLALEEPQSTNPSFKAELKTVKPGKEFALNISFAGVVSNATRQGNVVVKTSATNMPLITVNAYAMPQPALMAIPQQIYLPGGPRDAEYRASVTIRNNTSTSVTLSEPAVNAEDVTVQLRETQPGKAYSVSVVFPASFKVGPGDFRELTIKTSHPKYPVLHVPITQPATALPGSPRAAAPTPPK
jgi:hypothetical protein